MASLIGWWPVPGTFHRSVAGMAVSGFGTSADTSSGK